MTRPIILFAGKGGVGKTTLATAYAGVLASRGRRTLLVSTDPAHSTRDLLEVDLGPEPQSVPASPGLDALELDAEHEAARHVERVLADAQDVVSPEVLPAVERHLALALHSPGTLEAATLDRLVQVLQWCPARYDHIVVDTAPTGHTLRLLSLPTVLGPWLDGLVEQGRRVAATDRMLRGMARDDTAGPAPGRNRLAERRDGLREARGRLVTDALFHLVCVPERLPVAETVRAAEALRAGGMTLGPVLVNRLVPDSTDDFLRARGVEQRRRLRELQEGVDLPLVQVAHLPHDAVRPEDVRALGAMLVDGGL
ncbi:MAG: ArsA family ATPase [Actinomycetota bacterium]|nr:ArsA family ATPase [Actinomycetota bacterium]